MKLSFPLAVQDYLDYQLYTVSRSEKAMRKRLIGRLLFPIIYLLVGIIFIIDKNFTFVAFNLILAVLWYFFYPISERKRYENTFRRSIERDLKPHLNQVGSIEWTSNEIIARENDQEAIVNEKDVAAIVELHAVILIQLHNKHNFILPKRKIDNLADVVSYLQAKCTKLSIPYIDHSNWHWK
ncbi:MAG: hypothetical protein ACEQR5_05060 [Moraxellaceae bacterium]